MKQISWNHVFHREENSKNVGTNFLHPSLYFTQLQKNFPNKDLPLTTSLTESLSSLFVQQVMASWTVNWCAWSEILSKLGVSERNSLAEILLKRACAEGTASLLYHNKNMQKVRISQQSTPISGQHRGYPYPRIGVSLPISRIGVPRSATWGRPPPNQQNGVPPSVGLGYLPLAGWGTPVQVPGQEGGATPNWNRIACTCYTAGGMSLAFTQKDFLVLHYFQVFFHCPRDPETPPKKKTKTKWNQKI